MSNLRAIRKHLNLSQEQLGAVMGCTQGNVGFCERGEQLLQPDKAIKLIDHAQQQGVVLTLDQVYDRAPFPAEPAAA